MFIFLLSACSPEKPVEIEGMVYIPSGEFILGSDEIDSSGLAREFGAREKRFYENEKPYQKIFLEDFYIDKYEVTNESYKNFVEKTNHPLPRNWKDNTFEKGKKFHPINYVTWADASAYCKWAGKRLPTEFGWEKAARGPKGNRFPWGNEFDKNKANLDSNRTTPVGSMPGDKSFYGVFDMGGNVMEWTDSWYKPYPGSTMKNKNFGEKFKIARGGTGNVSGHYLLKTIFSRSTFRAYYRVDLDVRDIGFRCAK